MTNLGDKSEIGPLRATKSDRSREKSLYFLLQTSGKRHALAGLLTQAIFEEVAGSIAITKLEQEWSMSFSLLGTAKEIRLPISSFRFYASSRGSNLTESGDSIALSNLESANTFWAQVAAESNLTPEPLSGKNQVSIFLSLVRRLELEVFLLVVTAALVLNAWLTVGALLAFVPIFQLSRTTKQRNIIWVFLSIVVLVAASKDLAAPTYSGEWLMGLALAMFMIVTLSIERIRLGGYIFSCLAALACTSLNLWGLLGQNGPQVVALTLLLWIVTSVQFAASGHLRRRPSKLSSMRRLLLEVALTGFWAITFLGINSNWVGPLQGVYCFLIWSLWIYNGTLFGTNTTWRILNLATVITCIASLASKSIPSAWLVAFIAISATPAVITFGKFVILQISRRKVSSHA